MPTNAHERLNSSQVPPLSRTEIEARVTSDFADYANKTIEVASFEAYRGPEAVMINLEKPVRCLVEPDARPTDLANWTVDGWCDPIWHVKLLERRHEFRKLSSFWVYGTSYQVGTGQLSLPEWKPVLPAEH